MTSNFELFAQNYQDRLAQEILEVSANIEQDTYFAAHRVIAEKLGYDLEEVEIVDGAGDRGIDFWYGSDNGIYIYQVKTHNFIDQRYINAEDTFDNSGVTDLIRAKNFLFGNGNNIPDKLEKLKTTFRRIIINHKSQETDTPVHVHFTLVILGHNITSGALEELADFEASLDTIKEYDSVTLQINLELLTITDILRSGWREENNEWRDITGKKRNDIILEPMRHAKSGANYLSDNKSAIFYCRAYDLITAYDDFGYQIFEPNVRANIKNSKINNAIQESASHMRSMKEFRFLNNGITIICNNYQNPKGGRTGFKIIEPGIINGLQTVTSLHRAYNSLHDKSSKDYFEENCYVLVRLLKNDSVSEISNVVFATNNQNSMQPRNLVSNSTEQIQFATYFGNELGWFYEAKQGAWDAFKKDNRRWKPRINRKPSDFRKKRIDNHVLAQDWLAFLGFASRAANDKKHLFDRDKSYYELIFLSRPNKHAYEVYSTPKDAVEDSIRLSPDPQLMLLAHVIRNFASKVVPSTQANKKLALARAGVESREDISTAQEERILSEDAEYILNQALNAMSRVFVEFVGYTFFQVFGSETHRIDYILSQNHSMKLLIDNYDIDTVVSRATERKLEGDDLLIVMWLIFREAVQDVMSMQWNTAYRNARYKPRFILNNRGQICHAINEMDQVLQQRVPMRVYTSGINENEGYFGYIERIVKQ